MVKRFQQLYLPRVIQVVRGDAVHVLRIGPGGPPSPGAEPCRREARDDGPEQPVLLLEERDVAPPRGGVGLRRERWPVAPGAREFELGVAHQSAAHDVLPIGRVQHDLPDVVAAAARAPQRLPRREAADGPPQRGAVPRFAIEGLVEDVEQQRDAPVGAHGGLRVASPTSSDSALRYIGLRTQRYRPVATNSCGGSNGAGVPRPTRAKSRRHHARPAIPAASGSSPTGRHGPSVQCLVPGPDTRMYGTYTSTLPMNRIANRAVRTIAPLIPAGIPSGSGAPGPRQTRSPTRPTTASRPRRVAKR